MSRLTDKQRRATDPAATPWVLASAGTGKTHVLTARMLRLMLEGTPPDRILALTYTKAAAAEMKERVLKALGHWVTLDKDVLLAADIFDRAGVRADDAMLARARALFAAVIDDSQALKIQTIHSFCQSLLGRFPLEAGLSPRFEVIEEAAADARLTAALEALIAEADCQPAVAAAFAHLALALNEEQFQRLTRQIIKERALFAALARRGDTDALLCQRLGLAAGANTKTAETAFVAGLDVQAGTLARLADSLAGAASKRAQPLITAIRHALPAGDIDRYCAAFLTDKGIPYDPDWLLPKAWRQAYPDLVEDFVAAQQQVQAFQEQRRALATLADTRHLLTIAGAMIARYEAAKAADGVLDYSDLILKVDGLLAQTGIAPWILYKLDHGIDHLLVDEAQDTSPLGWRIIEALSGEFYAGDSAREVERSLFAVGDLKQSIFSFQGADPQAFLSATERFRALAQRVDRRFDAIDLDLSYRSGPAVLDLVNQVVNAGDALPLLTGGNRPIEHQPFRAGHGGLVELWPLTTAPKRSDDDAFAAAREAPGEETGPQQKLAIAIADHIRGMLDAGEILTARDRPVRPGDIMILLQSRGSFVSALVRELKTRGVAVAGADRLALGDSLAVQDLLAAARFALQPRDDLTLAALLKSPLIGLDETALYDLAAPRGAHERLWTRLQACATDERFETAHARCRQIRDLASTLAPFEFFAHLLGDGSRPSGFEALRARLGDEIDDPVEAFLALVLSEQAASDGVLTLERFVDGVTRRQSVIKREFDPARDEVRIMTVHGAKGLQAPIVYMPDCARDGSSDDTAFELSKGNEQAPTLPLLCCESSRYPDAYQDARTARRQAGAAEKLRLLYVAMTRAEDRLYLAGWARRGAEEAPVASWYPRLDAAMTALEAAEVETPTGPGRRYACPHRGGKQEDKAGEALIEPTPPAQQPGWLRDKPVAEAAPARPLSPSRPVDDPVALRPAGRGRQEALARGIAVHRLLEILPDVPPARRAEAARALLAGMAGLAQTAVAPLVAEVLHLLSDPAMAPLFAPGSLAEVPLTGLVGTTAVGARVDRLALLPDRVIVADYKTRRPVPATLDAVPEAYCRQMAGYRALLRGLFPDRAVECVVIWTEGPHWMTIPDERLDHGPVS